MINVVKDATLIILQIFNNTFDHFLNNLSNSYMLFAHLFSQCYREQLFVLLMLKMSLDNFVGSF